MFSRIAIIGSQGTIGRALVNELSQRFPDSCIYAFSRNPSQEYLPNVIAQEINYQDESSIEKASNMAGKSGPIDCIIVTTGILHDDSTKPEKSLRDINQASLRHIIDANTITPILIAKHFIPKMNRKHQSIFAALSARVGSISDNHLGGWYGYRASKAALNMMIRTLSIEINRFNNYPIILGLHPGTVDSNLSKPFQGNVPEKKLFTPEYSANKLCDVIIHATLADSGKCLAWDGQVIIP